MHSPLHATVLLAALALCSPGSGLCDAREEITDLERKRNDALVAQDWGAYDALLADEFFHAHVMGGILDKAPHLEHLRTGKSRVTSVVLEDLDVRLYGDVAVATAISHVDITHVDLEDVAKLTGVPLNELEKKGHQVTRHQRYLHVWVRKPEGWKLVARQATYLPDEK